MKILGIDPGSSRTGYALIERQGSQLKLLQAGTIEIKTRNPNEKLFYLAKDFKKLLQKTKPNLVAVEKLFFTKNIKTGIEVAQARGVIMAAALEYLSLKIQNSLVEYTPQQIKQAVTNYGAADKKAVAKMVAIILGQPQLKALDDTTDAIAIAITAAGASAFSRNI